MIEDDGTLFFNDKVGHRLFDVFAAARAFYRTHGDDYDQLAFYFTSGSNVWLGSPGALAASYLLKNDVAGIGLPAYDLPGGSGSAGRLQAVLVMNGLERYFDEPDSTTWANGMTAMDLLGHEFGHAWLSYVYVDSAGDRVPALLGRDEQHWNFFSDQSSIMEGCGWREVAPDTFVTDSVSTGYTPLDQYLMGLRPAFETPSVFVVNDPHDFNPPNTYVVHSDPFVGLGADGRKTTWNVSDVIAAEGPRVPDAATSPKAFRLGIALVTPPGAPPSTADLAKLESFRARFETWFAEATWYRGAVSTALDSRAGSVEIAHTPLGDSENAAAPRPLGARVRITGGGLGLAVPAGGLTLHWRPAGGGPWNVVPFASAGADSFAAVFPATFASGAFEYYLHAATDSAGIAADDPPAGALAPHAFTIGPDTTPPAITHRVQVETASGSMPRRLLARITDNVGLDTVWAETRANGGALGVFPTTRAGRDSFTIDLGWGLQPGQFFTYRFVARDASAAHNVAYSNAAFDTVRVTRDRLHDFENGADGFFHLPYWWSYRDAWGFSTEDASPPGGTSWKCGAPGGVYPPHLDAVLYSPLLNDVVPGTRLRFDHRYALEQANATRAWDGARVEVSVNNGPWLVATPAAGYTHTFILGGDPFETGTPCWSGVSNGWRTETVDLGAFGAGPLRFRFRMLTDDFYGLDGWFVDHVRVLYPDGEALDVEPSAPRAAVGAPWPNPARDRLRLSLALGAGVRDLDWALYDVQGRRVASLWRGPAPAGARELAAAIPARVAAGLYFARLIADGRTLAHARVVRVR